MKHTSKLGLPIWNEPETDVFNIEEFNKGNQAIDDIVINILNQINELVIGDTKVDLKGYVKEEVLKEYVKKEVLKEYAKEEVLKEYAKEIEKISSQLNTKANDDEVVKKAQGTLDDFNEETRRVILGLEEGQINAVLGEKNVTKRNIKDNEVCFNHLNSQGNLINPLTVIYNKIITQEGKETDLEGHYSTDYINIEGDEIYSLSHTLTSTGAWYDEI